jgi:purine-cytosine permease-like protein
VKAASDVGVSIAGDSRDGHAAFEQVILLSLSLSLLAYNHIKAYCVNEAAALASDDAELYKKVRRLLTTLVIIFSFCCCCCCCCRVL